MNNSPSGSLRIMKSAIGKSPRKSPRAKGKKGGADRQSQRLLSESSWDDAPLMVPGRNNSGGYVADKHVILKKPADGGKLGVKFRTAPDLGIMSGVVVTRIEENSAAASSSLLVGDIITSIDGVTTDSAEEAFRRTPPLRSLEPSALNPTPFLALMLAPSVPSCAVVVAAKPGASIYVLALGGTREVSIDKRMGDCGMTCAAAKHVCRGVLLKRIAKGSLADKAKLYPGAHARSPRRRAPEATACACVCVCVCRRSSHALHVSSSQATRSLASTVRW